jgi:hypothetical protein
MAPSKYLFLFVFLFSERTAVLLPPHSAIRANCLMATVIPLKKVYLELKA